MSSAAELIVSSLCKDDQHNVYESVCWTGCQSRVFLSLVSWLLWSVNIWVTDQSAAGHRSVSGRPLFNRSTALQAEAQISLGVISSLECYMIAFTLRLDDIKYKVKNNFRRLVSLRSLAPARRLDFCDYLESEYSTDALNCVYIFLVISAAQYKRVVYRANCSRSFADFAWLILICNFPRRLDSRTLIALSAQGRD